MTDPLLLRTDDNAIATLTMNNPGALNALSEGMLDALQSEFDRLRTDRSIRVVILRAAGRAFCAGHDLKEMTAGRQAEDGGKSYFQALFSTCSKMMLTIRELPQPVIAEVHGIATAAGCQLVATCDLAVAEREARFGVNGVNIGLFCSTPMVALSRNISRKKTFELLTTGDFLSADQALEAGLVNQVADANELSAATRALADKIAVKLAAAVKVGKEAYYRQLEMGLADAYAYTGEVMAENMMFRDTEEGIAAFLEKRPPDWE
ncbi:MAG: enoyl-CoA hydratase [Pseudomonadota bacterium]